MPPVASHRRAGDCADSCTAATAYGTPDDCATYRAASRSTLRECVGQRYDHSHTQQEQRNYDPTHWVTPLMLDFRQTRLSVPRFSQVGRDLINGIALLLRCSASSFGTRRHFIRVAIEAQDKRCNPELFTQRAGTVLVMLRILSPIERGAIPCAL
jgi:hypothetical protein